MPRGGGRRLVCVARRPHPTGLSASLPKPQHTTRGHDPPHVSLLVHVVPRRCQTRKSTCKTFVAQGLPEHVEAACRAPCSDYQFELCTFGGLSTDECCSHSPSASCLRMRARVDLRCFRSRAFGDGVPAMGTRETPLPHRRAQAEDARGGRTLHDHCCLPQP